MIGGLSLTAWWPLRLLLLLLAVTTVGLLVGLGRRWWLRALLVPVLVGVVSANVLVAVNAYYGYYLTVGQALGWPGQDTTTVAALNRHTEPAHGEVVSVEIPGPTSRFTARPADVYLPPVWFAHRHPELPVVVLLHGTPGSPDDWLNGGAAATTLDAWAGRHKGFAPIVVIPDINRSEAADTECVDSARGNVETYLTADVPTFVQQRFDSAPPGRSWAVAGLSEGGSCALMLALRHPDLFATFGDYSGLAGPRVGDSNDPAGTTAALFGGSGDAFNQHEPAWLLTHRRFQGLAGWFEVGADDTDPLAAVNRLAPLAEAVGIAVHTAIVPDQTHTFQLWRTAFSDSLPWLVQRICGLRTPGDAPQRNGRTTAPPTRTPKSGTMLAAHPDQGSGSDVAAGT